MIKIVDLQANKQTVEKNISVENEVKETEAVVEKETVVEKKIEKPKKNKSEEKVEEDNPKILNIDDVMEARINNTFASASKPILKEIVNNFEKLRDYSFDQQFGYLVCSLLDSTVRVAGKDSIIISYESDALVKSNLANLIKLENTYNKLNDSNIKIAIISDDLWDNLKNEYIENLKNNVPYSVVDEPELIFEELDKNDIISSSAVELFGSDIVEVE